MRAAPRAAPSRAVALLLAGVVVAAAAAAAAEEGAPRWRDSRSTYSKLPLWGALAGARSSDPVLEVPLAAGFECERPYARSVSVHVVVPTRERARYGLLQHLGMLGLTGADFFFYLRVDPGDAYQLRVKLPCGMTFQEAMVLPNIAEEGAVLFTHVALHFDRLPDALVLLHGGRLQSWHNQCAVAIRRLRAFYRGLGDGPEATPAMRAFASRAQTVNSCFRDGVHKDCCGSLFCRSFNTKVGGTDLDERLCPWERVGTALVALYGRPPVTQALCKLRDRTAASNWTVLGADVPEFFLNQRAILQKYADDPTLLAPAPPAAVAAAARRRLRGDDAEAVATGAGGGLRGGASGPGRGAADAAGGALSSRGMDGAGRRLAGAPEWQPPLTRVGAAEGGVSAAFAAARAGSDGARLEVVGMDGATAAPSQQHTMDLRPLENAKDVLFPANRERDLLPYVQREGQSPHNLAVYDAGRLWRILLMAHGLYDNATAPPGPGEGLHAWSSLQFVAPRHALQRAPKAFWEDAAFLLTHIGWRPREEWPQVFGMLVELEYWPLIGQRYTTLEANQAYVDVDWELGEDPLLLTCGK